MSDKLLPCPFCNAHAEFGQTDDCGGYFIQCTNAACGASTNLRYACGEDPKPLLVEQWNRRSVPDAGREQIAAMMLRCSIPTGHGDTADDLLGEIENEITSLRNRIDELVDACNVLSNNSRE